MPIKPDRVPDTLRHDLKPCAIELQPGNRSRSDP
jgi:hypothetical protein